MELESLLKEQFLNKKVEVKCFERDNFGKTTTKKISINGIVQSITTKSIYAPNIVVVIGRTPIILDHINDIKLI